MNSSETDYADAILEHCNYTLEITDAMQKVNVAITAIKMGTATGTAPGSGPNVPAPKLSVKLPKLDIFHMKEM